MNAVRFWQDVGIALLLASLGALAFHSLQPLMGTAIAARGCLLGLATLTLGWTLYSAQARVGRLFAAGAWLLIAALLAAFNPPFSLWLVTCVGTLWLLRSLYRYERLSGALLDAALNVLALAAAIATARHSGSVWLALWCFFLLQAFAAFLPGGAPAANSAGNDNDAFDAARRSAEAALARLSRHAPQR